jgi:hypothetical protein
MDTDVIYMNCLFVIVETGKVREQKYLRCLLEQWSYMGLTESEERYTLEIVLNCSNIHYLLRII